MAHARSGIDGAVFIGLQAVLVWAPLPLSSNRAWAIGVLALVLWLLLAARLVGACLGAWQGGRPQAPLLAASSAWPVACVAGFALVLMGQLDAPGVGGGVLVSQDPFQTQVYLLTTLVHLAALLLVLLCVNTLERAQRLLMVLVASGVLQAVIAVVLYSTGRSYQLVFTDIPQGSRATGTFPNPDHLAGYLELCLGAGLGLLLAQFGGQAQALRSWQQRLLVALTFLMSRKMLLRLMLVVMVVALVMTHSRMGNAAFFIALLLVGCLVASVSQRLRRPALWLVLSMALVDLVIVGQWVGLGRVVERFQDTAQSTAADAATPGLLDGPLPPKREESLQDRMRVPALSLPLVWAKPWFGHGGGTYYNSFPPIKPAGFPNLWDHTHNDYVEVAADTGLVGLALLLGFAAATAWRAARMLRDTEPRLKRGVAVAALMALSCMGLHSMVDFNMQIPANAVTFVVLLSLVWAVPSAASAAPHGMRGASRKPQSAQSGSDLF